VAALGDKGMLPTATSGIGDAGKLPTVTGMGDTGMLPSPGLPEFVVRASATFHLKDRCTVFATYFSHTIPMFIRVRDDLPMHVSSLRRLQMLI